MSKSKYQCHRTMIIVSQRQNEPKVSQRKNIGLTDARPCNLYSFYIHVYVCVHLYMCVGSLSLENRILMGKFRTEKVMLY